jgi:hypothetical protein
VNFTWSRDNLKEVELGILKRAASLDELADTIGCNRAVLKDSIVRWNAMCTQKKDEDFGRPSGTMMPIRHAPFYTGEVWPVVSNTQGGPVHNACQQIVDVNENPIPRGFTWRASSAAPSAISISPVGTSLSASSPGGSPVGK